MPKTTSHKAPVAQKITKKITVHGDTRIDEYFWLRDVKNPETLPYVKAENAYTEKILKDTKSLQKKLFEELKGRIKADDSSAPEKIRDYYYYKKYTDGKQYPIFCRKYKSLKAKEEITLDCNKIAKGHPSFFLAYVAYSPNSHQLAYAVDFNGSEKFTIFFKDLQTNKLLPDKIEGVYHSFAWASNNETVFYNLLNEQHKPNKIYRHELGTSQKKDICIYEETDPRFFLDCDTSRSREYIFINAHGNNMTEVHYLKASEPHAPLQCIEKRQKDHEYYADHHDENFYILTNKNARDFQIVTTPIKKPSLKNWETFIPEQENKLIENFLCFENFFVYMHRDTGITKIKFREYGKSKINEIKFAEKAYSIEPPFSNDFNTNTLRFGFSSLKTPRSTFDYNLKSHKLTVKKRQIIPSGYKAQEFETERIFVKSHDGKKIPLSIVYKKSLFKKDGSNPLYLYSYGSYGMSSSVYFSTARLSLLNRGFIFAIAHIRGGQEMGRYWYEEGKLLNKKNTFIDFISCAEHLIAKKYTSKGNIVAMGGSAGGMLMGTISNDRPDLFKGIVAHVPFVDVINTMFDETLPLTTLEYNEWGNPNDKKYYHYMKSYSPYDNVKAQNYPHMFILGGLNDPRVTYWEPTKWTARLRDKKTNDNLVLLKINMKTGHSGSSGRFEHLKEIALEYAFILKIFDYPNQ